MAASNNEVTRDEMFYVNDLITFRAGNKLFKVSASTFPSDNGAFAAMLALPNTNGEGTTDQNPICLPHEITEADFRSFLKVCDPRPFFQTPHELSTDDWLAVLRLANMWCLDDVRQEAILKANESVASFDPVKKVLLGRRYIVARWLLDGYEGLGRRDGYLDEDERVLIGLESTVKVFELREWSAAWANSDTPVKGNLGVNALPTREVSSTTSTHPADLLSSMFRFNSHGWKTERTDFHFRSAVRLIFKDELMQDASYNPERPDPWLSQYIIRESC